MAVVFGGAPHTLSDGAPTEPCPVERLIGTFRPESRRRGAPDGTRVVCGVFVVEDAPLHPLFASLPGVLVARADGQGGSMSSNPIADRLVRELDRPSPGGAYAVERLVELLCLEVLRAHAASGEPMGPSFLRGLTDRSVSRAMRAIVEQPGADLSVQALARRAGLSPSRFAARFRAVVGVSPMEFATRWRVDVAARWLVSTDWSVGEIAGRVGYESPAAFSRAFSRVAGQSPTSWRAERRDSVGAPFCGSH
jgi:AraC-like DNA-binding protein